jgi:nucleotide-binding universal stress UspA family protein
VLGADAVEEDSIAGQAATVILDVAESRQPDVIILGARGLGVWSRLILGSTSMAVVQRAKCPVLVIK